MILLHNRTFGKIYTVIIKNEDSQLLLIQKVITWRTWSGILPPPTRLFMPLSQIEKWLEMQSTHVYIGHPQLSGKFSKAPNGKDV